MAKFFWSYDESSEYVSSCGLNSREAFREWRKQQPRSFPIPSNPDTYYSEFEGWRKFLGNRFISQDELSVILTELQITSINMYRAFARKNTDVMRIPIYPEVFYPDCGEDFVGFRGLLYKFRKCISCASAWAKGSGIRSCSEWTYKAGRTVIPKSIPLRLQEYGLNSKSEYKKFLTGGYYEVDSCTCDEQIDWGKEYLTLEDSG